MRFLGWIQRHPAETVSICAAITAFAVSIASPFWDKLDTKPLLVTILLVLGVLLSAQVTDWFLRINRIERDVAAIARPRAGDVLRRRRDSETFEDYCSGARWIRVCGLTLGEVSGHRDLLLRLAQEGTELQFVLCTQEQIDKWDIGDSYGPSSDVLKSDIGRTLGVFEDISAEITKKGWKGSIEWRRAGCPPRLALVHIDKGRSRERLKVEMQPYGLDQRLRPCIYLSADDPWLIDFRRVSDELWDNGDPAN